MLTTDYQEFLNRLQKCGSKPYKIKHCLGSRDAWKWVRRNKWKAFDGKPCEQSLYSCIVDEVNKILAEELLEGHDIELPYQMGNLILRKTPAKVTMEDGVIKSNYRTDWKKTCRYMYEDEEAFGQHQRVKRIEPYIYHIKYYKRRARFQNRWFYQFRPNRSLVRALGKAIDERRVGAESIEY